MVLRAGALLAALLSCGGAKAQSVADFYRANPLHLIVAATAGEGYDAVGRLMARHLGRHIPGAPNIVVENMGGAAGRLAANHLFNAAPHDGSVLGEVLQTFALGQAIGESGVRYDARNFTCIGSAITPTDVFVVRRSSGVAVMADATMHEIAIGSTSVTSQNYIYPALANRLLGAKFRIVTGYKGASEINLALERNEIQGRGAFPWSQLKAEHKDWLETDFVALLAQGGLNRDPELPDTPTLVNLAGTPEARAIFEFMSLTTEVGRPLLAPPGVPADRAAALRTAFDDMLRDPQFLADATALKEEVLPKTAGALKSIAQRIVEFDPRAVERFKAVIGGSGG